MSVSKDIRQVFKDLEESLKLDNILDRYEREAMDLIASDPPPATANALHWMLAYIRSAKEHHQNGDIDALALAMMKIGAVRANAAFAISKRRTEKRKTAKQCFDEMVEGLTELPPSKVIIIELQEHCSKNCKHKHKPPSPSAIYDWIAKKKLSN